MHPLRSLSKLEDAHKNFVSGSSATPQAASVLKTKKESIFAQSMRLKKLASNSKSTANKQVLNDIVERSDLCFVDDIPQDSKSMPEIPVIYAPKETLHDNLETENVDMAELLECLSQKLSQNSIEFLKTRAEKRFGSDLLAKELNEPIPINKIKTNVENGDMLRFNYRGHVVTKDFSDELDQFTLKTLSESCRSTVLRTAEYFYHVLQNVLENMASDEKNSEIFEKFIKEFNLNRIEMVIYMGFYRSQTFYRASKCLALIFKSPALQSLRNFEFWKSVDLWTVFINDINSITPALIEDWSCILFNLLPLKKSPANAALEVFKAFEHSFSRLHTTFEMHIAISTLRLLEFLFALNSEIIVHLADNAGICVWLHNLHLNATNSNPRNVDLSIAIWNLYSRFMRAKKLPAYAASLESFLEEIYYASIKILNLIEDGDVKSDAEYSEVISFIDFTVSCFYLTLEDSSLPRFIVSIGKMIERNFDTFMNQLEGWKKITFLLRSLLLVSSIDCNDQHYVYCLEYIHENDPIDSSIIDLECLIRIINSRHKLHSTLDIRDLNTIFALLAHLKLDQYSSELLTKFCLNIKEFAIKDGNQSIMKEIYRVSSQFYNSLEMRLDILFSQDVLRFLGLQEDLDFLKVLQKEFFSGDSEDLMTACLKNAICKKDLKTVMAALKYAETIVKENLLEIDWLKLWTYIMEIVMEFKDEDSKDSIILSIMLLVLEGPFLSKQDIYSQSVDVKLYQFYQRYLDEYYFSSSWGQPLASTLILPFLLLGLFPIDFSLYFWRNISFELKFIEFETGSIVDRLFESSNLHLNSATRTAHETLVSLQMKAHTEGLIVIDERRLVDRLIFNGCRSHQSQLKIRN